LRSLNYVYQPKVITPITFAEGVRELSKCGYTVVESGVDMTQAPTVTRIRELARDSGILFEDYDTSTVGFRSYFAAAGYETLYPEYYRGNQIEKALEHFIALELLQVTPADVFIDIASEHSPLADIYTGLTGARTFSQDIMYGDGIIGNRIGGDACAMPVPDGFASKACLTCSLEHFEGNADTRLFVELSRVLRPGGAVCVVPFYINAEAVTQTDPTVSVPAGVMFDPGVPIYCAEGWGNRHGRFYSPESFVTRIMRPLDKAFQFQFVVLTNPTAIHQSIYARFAFVATRL
jgi:Methyltransferase domain